LYLNQRCHRRQVGEIVFSQKTIGQDNVSFELNLNDGIYYVSVLNDDTRIVKKIIFISAQQE